MIAALFAGVWLLLIVVLILTHEMVPTIDERRIKWRNSSMPSSDT